MKGVGDAVDFLTTATGIKVLVKGAANVAFKTGITKTNDCGCQSRKEKLNEMYPFKKEKINFKESENEQQNI